MFYPTKAHIRQITGVTVAVALVGTLGYVGTRASLERQSTAGARTQDIMLTAQASPVATLATSQHLGRFMNGVASGAPAAAVGTVEQTTIPSTASAQLLAGPSSYAASSGGVSGGGSVDFGGSAIHPRNHSAGGTGFSAAGYGMNGVGAWGGVSGSARPAFAAAPAASTTLRVRTSAAARTSKPGKSGGAAGVAGASGVAPTLVAGALSGGFTAGAGAVAGASGSVPAVEGQVSTSGPSPAGTPEPMSLLLLGTGLAGLYGVRRYVQ